MGKLKIGLIVVDKPRADSNDLKYAGYFSFAIYHFVGELLVV